MANFAAPQNPRHKRASDSAPAANPRFRGIASQLLAEVSQDEAGKAIGVSSSSAGEGVTNTVVNLALNAASLAKAPILLIDVASNSPAVHGLLGVKATPSAAAVLNGRQTFQATVQKTCHQRLFFLSGEGASARQEVHAWEALLDEAKRTYQLVLLDLPPVPELTSRLGSVANLDGVLLVVESERTRQPVVLRSKSLLERMEIEPLGVVLNKRKNHVPGWLYDRI